MAKDLTSVQDGLVVGLDYTLRLDDGEVLDSSEGQEPLAFIQGAGGLVEGFAQAIYGLKIGEEKAFVVSPAQGYGEYKPEATMLVPASAFPEGLVPEVGMSLNLQGQDGGVRPATIVEIGDEGVHLDLNHPLAGKTLHFHVKVLALREPTTEELEHGHVHSGDHHHH